MGSELFGVKTMTLRPQGERLLAQPVECRILEFELGQLLFDRGDGTTLAENSRLLEDRRQERRLAARLEPSE
ncbi:MAG: hypothetical protein NZ555_16020, partial [Geminicoccaceae bacterium]|nr:hypothetical protein [Geminicoccaceae bacterium]